MTPTEFQGLPRVSLQVTRGYQVAQVPLVLTAAPGSRPGTRCGFYANGYLICTRDFTDPQPMQQAIRAWKEDA